MSSSSKAEIWRQAGAICRQLQAALADNALVRRGARMTVLAETLSKALKDVAADDRTEVLSSLREMFPTELADPSKARSAPAAPPSEARGHAPPWSGLSPNASTTVSDDDPDPGLFAELVRGELTTFAAQMSQVVPGTPLKPGELTALSEAAVAGDAASLDRFRRALADLVARLKPRPADDNRSGVRRK